MFRMILAAASAAALLVIGLGVAAAADNKVKTETIVVPPADGAPDGKAPANDGAPGAKDGEETAPKADEAPAKPAGSAADDTDRPKPGLHRIPLDAFGAGADPGAPDAAAAPADEPADSRTLPDISYDFDALPDRVRRTREQILEAAKTGDVEALRPVLEANEVPPTLSLGEIDDPIAFLKASSGDENGREVLALLIEVLEAGYVHVDKGTAQEMYIWPYFARLPLDKLTPPQQVELFKLLTAQDVRDMEDFGAYIFYRVGIGPDGTWHYFVAGE
ncbi:MAG TPA: hypothetical protein PLJ34_04510 [Hyphomicrobiales bacterium]|nr:hypothetical protein [Kaistiaceae bacterium]HQF30691.1 hypothetical protein [Hyphomicrobiales bacterium]